MYFVDKIIEIVKKYEYFINIINILTRIGIGKQLFSCMVNFQAIRRPVIHDNIVLTHKPNNFILKSKQNCDGSYRQNRKNRFRGILNIL